MRSDAKISPSQRHRRIWQFGLRTLFALMTLTAICVGLFAARMERAQQQKASVSRLRNLAGGAIGYEHPSPNDWVSDGTGSTIYITEVDLTRSGCFPREWPPDWLERRLGIDFFGNVIGVGSWNYSGRDSDMADFKSFPRILGERSA